MIQSLLRVVPVALLVGLLGCTCVVSTSDHRSSAPVGAAKYQRAIDAVYPALVRIEVVSPVFRDGREVRLRAGGSGVIVSPEGHVVTNHHVAGKATSIVCVLPTKEEIAAERIGTDPLADICVLRLVPKRAYPFARFGDSTRLKVGDTVLAMGSPGSLSQSVTAGVVSNVDLIMPATWTGLKLDGETVGALVKWIAHDAAIFPGNSGGPLVNLDGEIVGINEIGLGLGGAIPSDLVKSVVAEIIRHGEPRRSSLGLIVQPLLKSSNRKEGALVSGIIPGSPAEKAGFKPGDIILTYAGEPVTARFGEDLPVINRLVFASPVGADIPVVIERGGEKMTLTVTTKLRERAMADNFEVREWGMTASNLTETVAKSMKRASTEGVLVTSIRPGGPCSEAKPPIQVGDVIVEMNGKPMKNIEALKAETAATVKDQKEPVRTLAAFERKNEQWLTLVKVGIKDLPDRSPEARKAWLPVSHQVLTAELADALALKGKTGVRLTDVFADRSAEKAGLKVGDIVTAVDGQAVHASRPEDTDVFPELVRQFGIGQTVKLSVIRGGKEMEIPVELEPSPRATREMKRYQDIDLGFTARDLSEEERRAEKVEQDVKGPVVAEVEPGSLAAVGNLQSWDIVISVDGQPTPDVTALRKVMTEIKDKKPGRVVFFVSRRTHTCFVEVETPWLVKTE